jgi:hypothetical protein
MEPSVHYFSKSKYMRSGQWLLRDVGCTKLSESSVSLRVRRIRSASTVIFIERPSPTTSAGGGTL